MKPENGFEDSMDQNIALIYISERNGAYLNCFASNELYTYFVYQQTTNQFQWFFVWIAKYDRVYLFLSTFHFDIYRLLLLKKLIL